MFGFGLFSTHIPYIVLLIGYIACWFWNAQLKTEQTDEDIQPSTRTEFVQISASTIYTDFQFHPQKQKNVKKEVSDSPPSTIVRHYSYFSEWRPQIFSNPKLKKISKDALFSRPPPAT